MSDLGEWIDSFLEGFEAGRRQKDEQLSAKQKRADETFSGIIDDALQKAKTEFEQRGRRVELRKLPGPGAELVIFEKTTNSQPLVITYRLSARVSPSAFKIERQAQWNGESIPSPKKQPDFSGGAQAIIRNIWLDLYDAWTYALKEHEKQR